MLVAPARKVKPYKGLPLEGPLATWYARNTGRDLSPFRELAHRLASELKPGDRVLEIAPGPGYLAIELARLGPWSVTGLDVSRSFVRIAGDNAARAGVGIDFRRGNASAMPFEPDSFDLIVCRAAFKNFADPKGALREMHRVLAPGGTARIYDLRREVSDEAIEAEVESLRLGRVDAFVTEMIFKHGLRPSAYSRADFEAMLWAIPFTATDIHEADTGFEIRLVK
ncbi:MAG TPA: class I SAM-dependent methyltransferase [Caulobacteraceae bacterium]|nr:class I SAM-dependent methyltransferase [Caulobacteraceae bacterium]